MFHDHEEEVWSLDYIISCWKTRPLGTVIHLNLVRSINSILDVLAHEMANAPHPSSPATSPFLRPVAVQARLDPPSSALPPPANGADAQSPPTGASQKDAPLRFTNTHTLLKLRLVPLRRVEADLKALIGAGPNRRRGAPGRCATRSDEFYVRSHASWRDALRAAVPGGRHQPQAGADEGGAQQHAAARLADAAEVIASCAEDMRALWADGVVRETLRRRRVRMEQAPGFFLDDIERIAARNYEPSDDDIVRARLRTLGVQEHKLVMERTGASLVLTRLSGADGDRAAWFPYFDDANAILFLAPISCYDELLQEDRRVNRLEDSFLLWKAIVQSKLLARCIIVLFLNKYDLLEKKLRGGTPVRKYLPSFGERENSAPVLAQYLHQKFKDQHREYSPQPRRPFYGYVTTAINTKATTSTLAAVRDGVLRHNLHKADFV
ncbi:guanine nucleotide binding protein, alpha subunit [Trametes elegans]|nr:guanine nucleotide binding protein, alpha subunit [Trametes elegans]